MSVTRCSTPKNIPRKNRLENDLISVINDLLRGVGFRAVVGKRDCIIDLPPYNLEGFGGGVCLVEALVVFKPVGVEMTA